MLHLTKIDKLLLKKYLPRDYAKTISGDKKCSDRLVQMVLKGDRSDKKGIISAAIQLALHEKTKQVATEKKISKLRK